MTTEGPWVFDTNVIVSAHLNPRGLPARLMHEVYALRLRLAWDVRILTEYRQVLERPKFQIPGPAISAFLAIIRDQHLVIPFKCNVSLPDPEDVKFLEVAAAAGKILVTGNTKHFPDELCSGIQVLTPREAWEKLS